MRIGTFLPSYWTDYGATTVAEAVRETAVAAAALGYVSLWADDHVIAPSTHADMGHIVEPLTTLASLIHLVPHVHLGTSTLVLPQRHPIVVAKQVATLDVLSGGRFILGIGVGWLEDEFQFLNADFARRGAVADEAIAAMQVLWSDQAATFHGRHYDFADAAFFPKPTAGRCPCGSAGIRRRLSAGPPAWATPGTRLAPPCRSFRRAWPPCGPSRASTVAPCPLSPPTCVCVLARLADRMSLT